MSQIGKQVRLDVTRLHYDGKRIYDAGLTTEPFREFVRNAGHKKIDSIIQQKGVRQ